MVSIPDHIHYLFFFAYISVCHNVDAVFQTLLEESEEIHTDLEAMAEKLQYLSSVYYTEKMSQQVAEVGRETAELRQIIKNRLQNLQDAAKVEKKRGFVGRKWG